MLIDSHCHFDFFPENEQSAIWQRAKIAGLETLIVPAVEKANWQATAEVCERFPFYAAYGLHPIYYHQKADILALDEWLTRYKAVAVGECGLDYAVEIEPKVQQFFFEAQVELSISHQLPLILHARRALEQVLQTLARYPKAKFVVHTFTGSDKQLEKLLSLGGYIGIGGTSTYPRAQRLRRQLATVPKERYLLETDAPDQPLYGHQGKVNEPEKVAEVASVLAELRDEGIAEVMAQSTQNSKAFFSL
ncbi:TatD family hydrolase [Suttonella ornithocola]|uniref:Uncharacterized deoxyribonuclease YjjV n=1 Tax=Suttonella ornithocola TaxID=279832 RepID=A0A380N136_9GAMM|nr:TatD family hydrolase [Suttonella ornithocola]SUO97843.1 Uncharacterized deoxyribonuclease YjjV [Suttonella ornithocola]